VRCAADQILNPRTRSDQTPCQAAKHANIDKSSVLLVLANRNQEDFTDLRTMGQGFKAAGARVITFDTDRARFPP
jgi:hypothetical protein